MIESGQIRCGMVVAGENGRPLVERTLQHLLDRAAGPQPDQAVLRQPDDRLRAPPRPSSATARSCRGRAHRLLGGVCLAATEHSELCQGDAAGGDGLEMQTDSEQLLVAGRGRGAGATWADFQEETGWAEAPVDRFVCHQVGAMHRRKLYEALGLDLAKDFSTFETLGNMGSVSLPATLVGAVEGGAVVEGNRVGLLGIGSGINCMMLALEW